MTQLGQAKPRLICSLIHKFGRKGVDDFDAFIEELNQQASPTVGELFVFVDEGHRTQSGKLHKTMKAILPDILMQDRLKKGRERLDQALETVELLCAPVEPPSVQPDRLLAHIHYFCGNVEIPEELKAREHQRFALYRAVASLLRAYANIADDLPQAGYKEPQIAKIKAAVTRAVELREHIRLTSGETIDLKAYEADMRHLIDTYIEARDPKKISAFDDMGLLEVIERSGLAEAIAQLPGAMRKNKDAVAETIANNVRSKIIKEHLNDPSFYDKMSALRKEILDDLKAKRISYEKFLKRIAEEVIKPLQKGTGADTPTELDTPAKRALYSNLLESGRVTIAAPSHMSLDSIRVFAITKLGWIRREQKKMREQEREAPREFLERESHYVWGKRYLLHVTEADAPPVIQLRHKGMLLQVRPGTSQEKCQALVEEWYRHQIREAVSPLVEGWETRLGVKVEKIFVQRMKTKWGSCNPSTHSIRLNTDLAKKPPSV